LVFFFLLGGNGLLLLGLLAHKLVEEVSLLELALGLLPLGLGLVNKGEVGLVGDDLAGSLSSLPVELLLGVAGARRVLGELGSVIHEELVTKLALNGGGLGLLGLLLAGGSGGGGLDELALELGDLLLNFGGGNLDANVAIGVLGLESGAEGQELGLKGGNLGDLLGANDGDLGDSLLSKDSGVIYKAIRRRGRRKKGKRSVGVKKRGFDTNRKRTENAQWKEKKEKKKKGKEKDEEDEDDNEDEDEDEDEDDDEEEDEEDEEDTREKEKRKE